MREMGPLDLAISHPVIVVPGSFATLGAFIAALNDASWWPIATVMFFVMVPILRLAKAREDYVAWKRQWDSMAGEQKPRRIRSGMSAKPWVGGILLALLGLFFAANASDPVYAVALVWLVLAVGIAAIVAKIANCFKRQPASGKSNQAVSIRISKPLLPVPRLRDAYRALPPHCQALLAQERERKATNG